MSLAIFDLDNTLIAGDSDHAWGDFLVEEGIVDREVYRQANDQFYQDYLDGTLDMTKYLEFSLAPLAQHPSHKLQSLRERFMEQRIQKMLLSKAQALLKKHQDAGDFLLIITATNRFVTEPIANLLGVHDLIATDPEIINGEYTGKVAGIPSFKEGKVERLNHWLNDKNISLSDSYFYSDSHNDIPLLNIVENAIAVDPDDNLRQHAEAQGWPVISLR